MYSYEIEHKVEQTNVSTTFRYGRRTAKCNIHMRTHLFDDDAANSGLHFLVGLFCASKISLTSSRLYTVV